MAISTSAAHWFLCFDQFHQRHQRHKHLEALNPPLPTPLEGLAQFGALERVSCAYPVVTVPLTLLSLLYFPWAGVMREKICFPDSLGVLL